VIGEDCGWEKEELVVGMSGDLKKMTERWFKDGTWLKELP